MQRHVRAFKDRHTSTRTDKTYTDAHAQVDMHRYAQTRKNMHRSIPTDMQEHSNTSADQHAQIDMHRHAQVRKNRHILT